MQSKKLSLRQRIIRFRRVDGKYCCILFGKPLKRLSRYSSYCKILNLEKQLENERKKLSETQQQNLEQHKKRISELRDRIGRQNKEMHFNFLNDFYKDILESKLNDYNKHESETRESGQKIIIVLRPRPASIPTLHLCLYSLLTQRVKPDEVFVWLTKDGFYNYGSSIPVALQKIETLGAQIVWYDKNDSIVDEILRQHTDSLLVFAESHVCYPEEWLESILRTNPIENVVCVRSHKRYWDGKNYSHWVNHAETGKHYAFNFAQDTDCVLCPPHSNSQTVNKAINLLMVTPKWKDLWFASLCLFDKERIQTSRISYRCPDEEIYIDEISPILGSSIVAENTLVEIDRNWETHCDSIDTIGVLFDKSDDLATDRLKVSVVIPVYNAENYLEDCLSSVCCQTLSDIEILCVNDHSTDRSLRILNSFAENDSRVRVINEINGQQLGPGGARNRAFVKARGDYIALLDSDDYLKPRALEVLYNCAIEQALDGIRLALDVEYENEDLRKKYRILPNQYHYGFTTTSPIDGASLAIKLLDLGKFMGANCTLFFRRQLMVDHKILQLSRYPHEDEVFLLQLHIHSSRMMVLDNAYYVRRVRKDSIMTKGDNLASLIGYSNVAAAAFALLDDKKSPAAAKKAIIKQVTRLLNATANTSQIFFEKNNNGIWDWLVDETSGLHNEAEKACIKTIARFSLETFAKDWNDKPKVSVIIPVYNTGKYLRQCLNSVLNQTLSNIEIICVNDGSTDESLSILKEYEESDRRIILINKNNSGYGHTMNVGIDRASAEYLAFLDSDDYVEKNAYEVLYQNARKHNADIIKAGYYEIYGNEPEIEKTPVSLTKNNNLYNHAFIPREVKEIFYIPPSNCFGLLKRDFINSAGIRHNETPGAAHQDTGFWFQTLAYANSMCLLKNHFYCYRKDRVEASQNNVVNYHTIRNEYDYILDSIKRTPETLDKVTDVYWHRRFLGYLWILKYLKNEFRQEFIETMSEDFSKYYDSGEMNDVRFTPTQRQQLSAIINNPSKFYLDMIASPDEIVSFGKPLVSVIIPVYNNGKHLQECLDSIIMQSLKNIEILCINDGSTDNSLDILNSYARKDARIIVISQKNAGAAVARNCGIDKARGLYLSILDADDVFESDMLYHLHSACVKTNADFCVCRADSFKNNCLNERTLLRHAMKEEQLPEMQCFSYKEINGNVFTAFVGWAWDKLFKAEFIKDNGIRFQDLRRTNDMLFVFTALLKARRITTIDNVLVHKRLADKKKAIEKEDSGWSCYYHALMSLKDVLVDMQLFDDLYRDFVNYALEHSLWHLKNCNEAVFGLMYEKLRNDWFNDFDILGKTPDFFYKSHEYQELLKIQNNSLSEYKKNME